VNEVIEYTKELQPFAEPPPGSLKPKSDETIHDVKERLQALNRGVT
jgi:hypothetical protein